MQTPANTSQLTDFSTTQALTERNFRTGYDIIYTKKYKRTGGSGTAKACQTILPITKSNDWSP